MGNSGFITANGVTGGSGTPSDPYVISGWDINASNVAAGIVVKDTTAPFIIRNVYVHSGGNVNAGMSLSRVSNAFVEDNLVSQDDPGIVVDTSLNVTVQGNTVHDINAYGIYLYYSNNSLVKDNTVFSSKVSGFFLFNANQNTVTNNTG